MTTATVERLTETQARLRRDEIVKLLGGEEASIRQRAQDYLLEPSEQVLFDELEDLDYLLSL